MKKPKKRSSESAAAEKKRSGKTNPFEFAPLPGELSLDESRPIEAFKLEPVSAKLSLATPFLTTETLISRINAFFGTRYISKAYDLVYLAVGLINELERLAKDDPRGVRTVAEKRATWPVMDGRHTERKKGMKISSKGLAWGKMSARISISMRSPLMSQRQNDGLSSYCI